MISCCKCKEDATWFYGPLDDRKERYFCDNCIKRGCSCNIIDGIEQTDDMGRKLPCCEYNYSEDGFEEETK
jgi:hypothetical protein